MRASINRAAGYFTDQAYDPRLVLLLGLLSLAYVGVQVIQVFEYVMPAGQFKIVHVGGAALLICLYAAGEAKSPASRWIHFALAAVAAGTVWYIFSQHDLLTTKRAFLPNRMDFVVAWAFLLLCLYASMREWGWVVSLIAVVGLFYGYFGHLMPEGLFYHGGIRLSRLIGYTSIPYFSGLLGGLAELSAGTIFPFMIFAAALQVTGCVDFIMRLAYRIGGNTRAGPAQIAIISSGMMGMVSGSSVANVASTGALTIPLMKRVGFQPQFAGAVEAVASTGGQIAPPVMGLAAFLIVGITGIPYGEIIITAAFPALIYYLYLMGAVHLRAVKVGLDATADNTLTAEFAQNERLWITCLRNSHFFIAVTYLVWVLLDTNLPGRTSLEATGVLLFVYLLRELAISWRGVPIAGILSNVVRLICRTAYMGARSGSQIAIIVAVIGVLVDLLTVTGFAQKLSFAMLEIADGSLPLLLIMAAFACLAFGLGLPTSAAYILVALMGAPALVALGVPLLAAHFFVFFFANISAITPPVAICALVAAKIAGASFFRTAFIAVRLGLPGFILPFIFVVHPEILGIDSSLGYTAFISVMALTGIVALNVILEGYLFRPLNWLERLILLPAALGLLHPAPWTSFAGVAIFAALALWQWVGLRSRQVAHDTVAPAGTTAANPPSSGGSR